MSSPSKMLIGNHEDADVGELSVAMVSMARIALGHLSWQLSMCLHDRLILCSPGQKGTLQVVRRKKSFAGWQPLSGKVYLDLGFRPTSPPLPVAGDSWPRSVSGACCAWWLASIVASLTLQVRA